MVWYTPANRYIASSENNIKHFCSFGYKDEHDQNKPGFIYCCAYNTSNHDNKS